MKLRQYQLADLLGVSARRVRALRTEGRLATDHDGFYDTADPINRTHLQLHFHHEYVAANPPDETEDLAKVKAEEEILYLRARRHKVDIATAQTKKQLVPFDLARQAWGAFGNALRNNFLTLGDRLTRNGDTKLRERINTEVTRMLKKTRDQVAAEISRISHIQIEVENDDENGV